jgi:hypothetical protein
MRLAVVLFACATGSCLRSVSRSERGVNGRYRRLPLVRCRDLTGRFPPFAPSKIPRTQYTFGVE